MNFVQILNDVQLWVIIKNNLPQTLANFPKLAAFRWQWIVDKKEQLGWTMAEAKSDYMVGILQDINISIENNYNPLKDNKKFLQYMPILSTITINQLGTLTQKEQELLQERRKQIENLTETDFRKMYEFLKKDIEKATKYINLHTELNMSKTQTVRNYIFNDIEHINAAIELEETIEHILFDYKTTTDFQPNLISTAIRNLDPESQIQLQNNYKSAVSVPFEKSLEHMAHRYLGSSDRWLELAAVNKLSPPYIDYDGTIIRLTSNATERTVQVPSTYKNNISVGQKIIISSSRYKKPEPALIDSISIDEQTMTLTLNRDVSKYVKRDLAYIKIFKPNTIQKDSFVLIPQTTAIDIQDVEYDSQEFQRLDRVLRAFGTDFQVNDKDDWDLNGNDIKLISGIPAIKQAVGEILKTATTDNKWHKSYGISENIGVRYIGFDQATSLAVTIRDSIKRDRRFSNVIINNIATTDTSITINLTVWVPEISDGIPLSFVG